MAHLHHPIPAAHSFRHLSLIDSPPDSDHDAPRVPVAPLSVLPSTNFDATSAAGYYLSERTRSQPRRTSALSYQNSGARDIDRTHSRSPRNLVVVIPSSDFPLQQGQLGNILSMGPRHRLSQGILMPLFPSMFGQLNAIAREFNFPSIVGLCLYLHINENGVTMTPRISDDSWQYLFGHFFETRPPSWGQHSPIGGRIEFDIDPNKARWFDAWVSGTFRDSDPLLPFLTSQPSLAAHWQEERRGMNEDEQSHLGRWNTSRSHSPAANSRSETLRHLPKKLSLVDRLESLDLHVPSKSWNHSDLPDSPQTHSTDGLSPPPQSAIPQVARSDLEQRVSSWREITNLHPISMTETYQPTPDDAVPVGVTAVDRALEDNFRQTVGPGESHWSVPLVGPSRSVVGSPIVPSRSPLVRPDRTANGPVPLSPITVTSWGPTDHELCSVISTASRLPSPDLGERVVENTMAPRLSAVWGNSFGWHAEKTWKVVYPYSASQTKPMVRLQLQDTNGPLPQHPNLVIHPIVDCHLDTHSLPNISARPKSHTRSLWGSSFGWQRGVTWREVYPYSTTPLKSVALIPLCGAGGLVSTYPMVCIYPAVYPYFEIYPPRIVEANISRLASVGTDESNNLETSYSGLATYPAVYPHIGICPPVVEDTRMKLSGLPDTSMYSSNSVSILYPSLVIYPAVYPYFDLYPVYMQISQTFMKREVDMKLMNAGCLPAEYPSIAIHPAAYPNFDIYPPGGTVVKVEESRVMANDHCIVDLVPCYPSLVIYPAVYPCIDVYPPIAAVAVALTREDEQSEARCRRIEMRGAEIELDEQPANSHIWSDGEPLRIDLVDYSWSHTSAEPSMSPAELPLTPFSSRSVHIDCHAQMLLAPSTATTWGPQDDNHPSGTINIQHFLSLDLGQRVVDDVENIKHPHQPWYLVWPFFEVASQIGNLPLALEKSVSVPEPPHKMIYPPVCPHSKLYPTWADIPTPKNQAAETLTNSCYPILDIYPAVYPHFNIYPELRIEVSNNMIPKICHEQVEVKLPSLYPNFDIYYACYPYNLNCIYPPSSVIQSTQMPIERSHGYPWLVIYPPVYPFIIPYPTLLAETSQPSKPQDPLSTLSLPGQNSIDLKLPVQHLTLDIGYPWSLECIYPAVSTAACSRVVNSEYRYIRIDGGVYPFIQPYPNVSDPVDTPAEPDENIHEALFALSEERTVQDLDACDLATSPSHMHSITQRARKSHAELHVSIFRSLEKQLTRNSKTHSQLHLEVFRDDVVRTPSGYVQDLTPLSAEVVSVGGPPRQPAQNNSAPRSPRSTPRTCTVRLPDKLVFPLGQSMALSPISPVHVRSPSVPPSLPLAVSETPIPRACSPTHLTTHKRSASSRLSQAVKSMIPRRNSSASPVSPSSRGHEEHVEDPKSPTRFLSSVGRLPRAGASDFLTRTPQSSHRREGSVLRRARAYERAISTNQSSNKPAGAKEIPPLLTLPPLPPMPSMSDVAWDVLT